MTPLIRRFRDGDAVSLYNVFFQAVRVGANQHYTDEQRCAWAPDGVADRKWTAHLADNFTLVAEIDGTVVGFFTVTKPGLVDLAYVHPDWIGLGVARHLHNRILSWARAQKLPELTSKASHMAKPFFQRQGWQAGPEETIIRNGVKIGRWPMTLALIGN